MRKSFLCLIVAMAQLAMTCPANAVDFFTPGGQNEAQRDQSDKQEQIKFYNYYKTKVAEMLRKHQVDPRTGQYEPTRIYGAPGTKQEDVAPGSKTSRQAQEITRPRPKPCSREGNEGCIGTPTSLEDAKRRFEERAAADPTHAKYYQQAYSNLERLVKPQAPKAKRIILMVTAGDIATVARCYLDLASFWEPRKEKWDAEAYIVAASQVIALRFIKENRENFFSAFKGGMPLPIQVVGPTAMPAGVNLEDLPAIMIQVGKETQVVRETGDLERVVGDFQKRLQAQ